MVGAILWAVMVVVVVWCGWEKSVTFAFAFCVVGVVVVVVVGCVLLCFAFAFGFAIHAVVHHFHCFT